MDHAFDAIVIGAGPAGASTAILLARAGWRVALVEKAVFPRRKVCGECIAASNFPLLAALGVGAAIADLAGPPLRRVAVMQGDHAFSAALPPYADARHRWGRALGREHLDALLLDQAGRAGATIFQPFTARVLQNQPGQAVCEIARVHAAERGTLTAPVLIAAQGSWDITPDQHTLTHAPPLGADLFAFKANFRGAQLDAGLLPVLCFAGGYGGMVLAGQGAQAAVTLAFCMRRDQLARSRLARPGQRAAEAAAAGVAEACAGVRRMLAGAQRQGAWLSVGPIRPGIRMPRQGCPAFLVGNAAGEAHPIIGEGMSMAIQSAWMLAQLLIRQGRADLDPRALARLRRQYAQAWRRDFAPRIHIAALFAHLAMRPALSGGAAALIGRFPQLLTHAARWSGKVSEPAMPA